VPNSSGSHQGGSVDPVDADCGYPVRPGEPVRIPLRTPVNLSDRGILRIGYYTNATGALEITAGRSTQRLPLLNDLAVGDLVVSGAFDEVVITAEIEESAVCITDLEVGSPWPRTPQ
ncbi:MAG: hypothetical protein WAW88_10405, partial [Nocardioides sp.]